jgi:hypothetical protein
MSQCCPKCFAQIFQSGPCPGCGAMVIKQGSWWDDPRTRRIGIAIFAAILVAVLIVMSALLASTRPRRAPQIPVAAGGTR